MMKLLISSVSFLFLFLVETSFLTSLPFPISLTPLVFAVGIYLLQHRGLLDGFVWICAYGFFLQLLHMNSTPFVFVLLSVGGIMSFLSARHVFSNRSLYGVLACGVVGFFSFIFLETLMILVARRSHEIPVLWKELFFLDTLRLFVLIITMIAIYFLANPVKMFFLRRF